jgi:hypothetical protein
MASFAMSPCLFKNALPTFVCIVHKTFGDLITDLVEVYVDDIIAKIKSRASLLDKLALVFDRLRSTRTKLNSDKCLRGHSGQAAWFLGFILGDRGQLKEDQDNRSDAAFRPHQGCAEAHGMLGHAKLVYLWTS